MIMYVITKYGAKRYINHDLAGVLRVGYFSPSLIMNSCPYLAALKTSTLRRGHHKFVGVNQV